MTDMSRRKITRKVTIGGVTTSKQFVQNKGESLRALTRRANEWQVKAREKTPGPNMTLGEAAALYNESRIGERAAATLEDDVFCAKLLEPIAKVKMDKLDPFQVERLMNAYRDRPRTAKKIRDYGRKLYNWLAKRRWITENPFALASPARYAPAKWEEPVRAEDFDKALECVKQPSLRALLLLLRWTAMRPKSARELVWPEVQGDWIVKQTAKTVAGTRPILLPKPARDAIEALPKAGFYVFLTNKGTPYAESTLIKGWKDAQEKAGLTPRKLYDLKHLRITEMRSILMDDAAVARMAGLSSADVVRGNYAQFDVKELRRRLEE